MSEYKFVIAPYESQEIDFSVEKDFSVKGPHRSYLKGRFAHSETLAVDRYGAEGKLLRSLRAPTAYIEELYVSRAYRTQGVGSKMMRFAIKELGDLGVEYIYFEALPFDVPLDEENYYLKLLIKFYKKLGFDEIWEFKGVRVEHWPIMIRQIRTSKS